MQRKIKQRYKSGIRKKIINHISENINIYFKILIIFIIGICIGIFVVNQLPEIAKQNISEYINNSITELKEGSEVSKGQLLKTSVIKNIVIALVIWFFSLTILGSFVLYFVTLIIGITFGYTISAIMTSFTFIQGLLFFVTSMFLQNMLSLPAIFYLVAQGIKSQQELSVKQNANTSLKYTLVRNSAYAIIVMFLLVIASLIEVYASGRLVYSIVKYL